MKSAIITRKEIIDYIAPELELFKCEHALLFGSRHAQAPLVQHTKWLFDQGFFERLIISGGCTHGMARPEALDLADQIIRARVPADVVLTECRSRNTGENVSFWHRQSNELKVKRLPGSTVQKPAATPVTSAQTRKA